MIRFFPYVSSRQIDEAAASAAAEERMEEEAKGECEIEREEEIRWDIEKKNLIAEENERYEMYRDNLW